MTRPLETPSALARRLARHHSPQTWRACVFLASLTSQVSPPPGPRMPTRISPRVPEHWPPSPETHFETMWSVHPA